MNCAVYVVHTGLANTCGQPYPAARVPCHSNNVTMPWPVSTGHVCASGAPGQNGNKHRADQRSRADGNGSSWADKVRGHEVRTGDIGVVHDGKPGDDHFTTQTREKVDTYTKMQDNAKDLLHNIEMLQRFADFISNEVRLANHTIDQGNQGNYNNYIFQYMVEVLVRLCENVLNLAKAWIQQNTLQHNTYAEKLHALSIIGFINRDQKHPEGSLNVSVQGKQLNDVQVLENCKFLLLQFPKTIQWVLQAHDKQERNNLHTQHGIGAATITSVDPERLKREAQKYVQKIDSIENNLRVFDQSRNMWTGNFKRKQTLANFYTSIDSLISMWDQVIPWISHNTPEFQGIIRELNSVNIEKYIMYTMDLDEHNVHDLHAPGPRPHSDQISNCFRVVRQLQRLIEWLLLCNQDGKMRKQPPNTMLPFMYQTIDIKPVNTILDSVCAGGYDELTQYAHWERILHLYVQGLKTDAQWRQDFNFPDVDPENYKRWFNQLSSDQKQKLLKRALKWAYGH